MPAAVAPANPTTVMPYSLAVSFQSTSQWPFQMNIYRDKSAQAASFADSSRRSWAQGKALTVSELQALRDFYLARRKNQQEFYFYDVYETVPPQDAAGYDPTGVKTAGRYVVRFEGEWNESQTLTRTRVSITLLQVS